MNKQIQEGKTKTATYNTTGVKMIIKVNAQSSEEIATSGYAQPKEQELETVTKNILLIGHRAESVDEKLIKSISEDLSLFVSKRENQAKLNARNRIVKIVEKNNIPGHTVVTAVLRNIVERIL